MSRRYRWPIVAGVMLVVSPVLYWLSFGPLAYVVNRFGPVYSDSTAGKAWHAYHQPVWWVEAHWPALRDARERYAMAWWELADP